jgi:lipid-binding SYLF domain-containing protein
MKAERPQWVFNVSVTKEGSMYRGWALTRGVVGVLAILCVAAGAMPAFADDAADAKALVEKAKLTMDKFSTDPAMGGFRDAVKRAKGVFISPQVLRGAFIIGVSGGSGVLLARDEKANKWGGPAFYTVGEASFGLQAGGDAQEVVLLAMTERGVTKLLSASTKLGTDASVAAGPVGAGVTAETAGLSADIISFALSKGVFMGVSLEGAVVGVRGALNKAYYGKEVNPTDILIRQSVTNPQAAPLLAAVVKVAGGK